MKFIFFLACLFAPGAACTQSPLRFEATDSPKVFGPGFISDGFANRDIAISPDGNDLFFSLQWYFGLYSAIFHTHKINGVWTMPDTAWFSGRYNDLEPAFSSDGKRIYFSSNRPLTISGPLKDDYDIWYLRKESGVWTGPFNMGASINSDKDEFYPSPAKNGNLYFTRNHDDNGDDIFISEFKDGAYTTAAALPESVNSRGDDFNAFVDPDERYIIFSSYKRKDDLGKGDLYCSKRIGGAWQTAVHIESGINSAWLDYSPYVSPDHRYFFFTSKRPIIKFPFTESRTAAQIRDALSSYGNGFEDIYIMNYSAVSKLLEPGN